MITGVTLVGIGLGCVTLDESQGGVVVGLDELFLLVRGRSERRLFEGFVVALVGPMVVSTLGVGGLLSRLLPGVVVVDVEAKGDEDKSAKGNDHTKDEKEVNGSS